MAHKSRLSMNAVEGGSISIGIFNCTGIKQQACHRYDEVVSSLNDRELQDG